MESNPLDQLPINLDAFIQRVGVKDITIWRWRRNGWLETVNIAGRQYVMPKAIEEFNRRAAAGEFAKEHKTPKRKTQQPENPNEGNTTDKAELSHSE